MDALLGLLRLEGPVRPLTLLFGEGGVGKTRLAAALADEARRRGWTVVRGQAYPVEAGVPYALLSDAFVPFMRDMDQSALTVLTRGGDRELTHLFPALSPDPQGRLAPPDDPEEFRTRLFWNFVELLKGLGSREPLLVLLEDLHWADESSLELLHFTVRNLADTSVRFLGTVNSTMRDRNARLVQTERSLSGRGLVRPQQLEALSQEDTEALVSETFQVASPIVREFAALLYGWTRGNAFFIHEILGALVAAGHLRNQDGTWIGWEARKLELPRSIRDAVVTRLQGLSLDAAAVADLIAVVGTRAPFDLLAAVSDLPERELLEALEELVAAGVLEEMEEPGAIVYDFHHPLGRETLYQELGLTRARLLHGAVAEAMEALHGKRVMEHAGELAYHFSRGGGRGLAPKAVRYLAAAGRQALARNADREAANYLKSAIELLESGVAGSGEDDLPSLVRALARARERSGRYGAAIELWERVLEENGSEAPRERAVVHRHLGLCNYWSGRHEEALGHYGAALEGLGGGDDELAVKLHLARGVCLQELGRGEQARGDVERALALAEGLGDKGLLARAHRALALLYIWTGPPREGREHALRALEYAEEAGDRTVLFWSQWALAVVEGLIGSTREMARRIEEAREVAAQLRSPVLRLWTAELAVEHAYAIGDWDSALARGERAIAQARAMGLPTLLPRLLVWTSLVYLGRGDLERARELVDEAWEVSGADRGMNRPVDVHVVVPAHIGRAACLLAEGQYERAVAVGEAGLAIADRSGYVIWAIHRLLPVIAEAHLYARDIEGARKIGTRIRKHARTMDHALGLAWADACDALVAWLSGDPERGARLMREAATSLEAIPVIPDAARIRRQLAGRLAEIGERDAAVTELRSVHDVFAGLGAEVELEKTRNQLREVGSRPPTRSVGEGAGGLTAREAEIARLVAARKSNKAVARELSISPRTVSTHLSNIYKKLGVESRGALSDLVREGRLPPPP